MSAWPSENGIGPEIDSEFCSWFYTKNFFHYIKEIEKEWFSRLY